MDFSEIKLNDKECKVSSTRSGLELTLTNTSFLSLTFMGITTRGERQSVLKKRQVDFWCLMLQRQLKLQGFRRGRPCEGWPKG